MSVGVGVEVGGVESNGRQAVIRSVIARNVTDEASPWSRDARDGDTISESMRGLLRRGAFGTAPRNDIQRKVL